MDNYKKVIEMFKEERKSEEKGDKENKEEVE